jgi:IS30 family transposase
MTEHKGITVPTKVNVYFCDPQSPWQRGTNENTDGLLPYENRFIRLLKNLTNVVDYPGLLSPIYFH